MALYTDRAVFGIQDLAAHETGVLDTASAEGIDLTTKIEIAREEVAMELLALLHRMPSADAQGIALGNVVVTPPLRMWQTFHTLEIVYRDAYHNQLNDRYKGKWQEYRDLSKWAAGLLSQIGLGVVASPIPEAEAPVLTAVNGGLRAGTYFVRLAWRNGTGEEGYAGKLGSIELLGSSSFRVEATPAPGPGVSFTVYAGVTPQDLYLQTETPVAAGSTWTAGVTLATGTAGPGSGQEPGYLRQVPRLFLRG